MNLVIAFSLFGSDPKYYVGAERNIILNKRFFPEWETVIYYHPNMILDGYVEKLKSLGGTLIDVRDYTLGGKESIHYPYFWRFFSFLEDKISMVRDLDSRPSAREAEYTKRWLESSCDYFIIRDHPWHAPVPSGLLGMKRKIQAFEDHFIQFVNNQELTWGADQEILYQYMQNISSEDIFYCGFDKIETYIPRDNENFFIGMQLDENDNPTVPSGEKCLSFLKELNL